MAVGDRKTVALMFVDIEGSTNLVRALGDDYVELLFGYRDVLEEGIAAGGGQTVDTEGDGHFARFPTASGAVLAAIVATRGLAARTWPGDSRVRARIGIHIGEILEVGGDVIGLEIHRAARIAASGHGGQILLSKPTADAAGELEEGVRLDSLGSHRFKDLSKPEQVFQVTIADLQAEFPPIKSLNRRVHNLPVQLTSFVGRDDELAETIRLLGEHRLVTVTAAGGVGKTRQAIQAAAAVVDDHDDGVFLVELAPISDDSLVLTQVAAAVELAEKPNTDLAQDLVDHLRSRHVLLVLDNCEHVLAGAADMASEVLSACPNVKVLATSREPLGLGGEITQRLDPLASDGQDSTPSAAARLFADRAAAIDTTFALTDDVMDAVDEICTRLAGIPLAIELAAGRLKLMTPRQVADRLDDQFKLLTGTTRDTPSRHHTLEAVIASSYELLDDDARQLLRHLAVFVGRFSIEGAEAMHTAAHMTSDFFDPLTRLVDTSLVTKDETDLRILEPIRRYGLDRLDEAGEIETAHRAHATYFADAVRGGGAGLPPQKHAEWIAALSHDEDNHRSALQWAIDNRDENLAYELAGGLARYWYRGGHYREAIHWFAQVLQDRPAEATEDLGTVLRFAAAIAIDSGRLDEAHALLEDETAVAEERGDPVATAQSLNLRGSVSWTAGDLRDAIDLMERSFELVEPTGDPFVVRVLTNLCLVNAELGRIEEGRTRLAELERATAGGDQPADVLRARGVLALYAHEVPTARDALTAAADSYEELGMAALQAMTLRDLSVALWAGGDGPAGFAALGRALEIFESMGGGLEMATVLTLSARFAQVQGNIDEAHDMMRRAVEIVEHESGTVETIYVILATAGLTAAADPARATQLYAAALTHAERIGLFLPPALRSDIDQGLVGLSGALGDTEFATNEEMGRSWTLEEALNAVTAS